MRTFSETLLENKSKWTSERAEEAPKHLSEDPSTAPRLFPLRLRLRLLLSLLSLLPEGRDRLCLLPPFLPTLSSDQSCPLRPPVSSSLLASFLPSFYSPVIFPAPLSFHIPSFSLSSLVPSVLIWSGVSPSMCQHQQSSLFTHTQRQWTRGRTSVSVTLGAQEHLRSI